MNKERDYFFDNLKAVLIFLVVLGHFLLPIRGDNVLNNSHVVNQVNRILALHTPQLIRNLKRQRAR